MDELEQIKTGEAVVKEKGSQANVGKSPKVSCLATRTIRRFLSPMVLALESQEKENSQEA